MGYPRVLQYAGFIWDREKMKGKMEEEYMSHEGKRE